MESRHEKISRVIETLISDDVQNLDARQDIGAWSRRNCLIALLLIQTIIILIIMYSGVLDERSCWMCVKQWFWTRFN